VKENSTRARRSNVSTVCVCVCVCVCVFVGVVGAQSHTHRTSHSPDALQRQTSAALERLEPPFERQSTERGKSGAVWGQRVVARLRLSAPPGQEDGKKTFTQLTNPPLSAPLWEVVSHPLASHGTLEVRPVSHDEVVNKVTAHSSPASTRQVAAMQGSGCESTLARHRFIRLDQKDFFFFLFVRAQRCGRQRPPVQRVGAAPRHSAIVILLTPTFWYWCVPT
jgi:hypothetical protein